MIYFLTFSGLNRPNTGLQRPSAEGFSSNRFFGSPCPYEVAKWRKMTKNEVVQKVNFKFCTCKKLVCGEPQDKSCCVWNFDKLNSLKLSQEAAGITLATIRKSSQIKVSLSFLWSRVLFPIPRLIRHTVAAAGGSGNMGHSRSRRDLAYKAQLRGRFLRTPYIYLRQSA
jgi:hypothetical protein